jgi:Protein of unknown function (DUF3137)
MLYHDFRIFYNQVIHPELLHMERRRQRLIRLIWLIGFLILGAVALQIYVQIFVVTLLLLIPVGIGIAQIIFAIQTYLLEFKPRIVSLVLDYIDNGINYHNLQYDPKGMIPEEVFLESGIFAAADDYAGEDLIQGQVRETPFVLSELRVSEFSDVRSQLDRVFNGIFLCADFENLRLSGSVLILPDANMKYLSRSERAFHRDGGRRIHGVFLPEFETFFNTYATPDVQIQDVVSEDLQRVILRFRARFQEQNRKKEIYFSLLGDNLFIALTQDRDLLEPNLWRSNANYETIKEFHDDIAILLELVLEIDVMN